MMWTDYGKLEERSTREKNRELERKAHSQSKSYGIADNAIFALLFPNWMLARVGSINEAQFRTPV